MTSAPAISFDYRPPAWLRTLHAGVAALALIAIGVSGLPWWAKAACLLPTLALALRAGLGLRRSAVSRVEWSAAGTWRLCLASGAEAPAALASFRILGTVILLRLRAEEGATYALVLGAGNSHPELRRRLRVRLRAAEHRDAVEPTPARA